jgi:hypothetical protein
MLTIAEQARKTGLLGERPVIVAHSRTTQPIPDVSAEGNADMRRGWLDMRAELAASHPDRSTGWMKERATSSTRLTR